MSAASCIVFIGVRLDVDVKEIESLEARIDTRLVAARAAKLDTYWRGPREGDSHGAIFIGSRLGVLGPEDQMQVCIVADELTTRMAETRHRLLVAGFNASLAMHIEWMND